MRAKWLAKLVLERLVPSVACRPPDIIIGEANSPYMLRWHVLPRNPLGNIYLHRFLRSDDDRAHHSHPWVSMSFIVAGAYTEHLSNGKFLRDTGSFSFRRAKPGHRIELHAGPVWTLFATGPRIREWDFLCPQGRRHWKDFVAINGNVSSTGRGCD